MSRFLQVLAWTAIVCAVAHAIAPPAIGDAMRFRQRALGKEHASADAAAAVHSMTAAELEVAQEVAQKTVLLAHAEHTGARMLAKVASGEWSMADLNAERAIIANVLAKLDVATEHGTKGNVADTIAYLRGTALLYDGAVGRATQVRTYTNRWVEAKKQLPDGWYSHSGTVAWVYGLRDVNSYNDLDLHMHPLYKPEDRENGINTKVGHIESKAFFEMNNHNHDVDAYDPCKDRAYAWSIAMEPAVLGDNGVYLQLAAGSKTITMHALHYEYSHLDRVVNGNPKATDTTLINRLVTLNIASSLAD